MTIYRSYGALDDQFVEDGDLGFQGFNDRIRSDQLPAGMLSQSENGRLSLNGEWQARKGVNLKQAPLATGADALKLTASGFHLENDTTVSTTVNSGNLILAGFNEIADLPATGHIIISANSISGADGVHAYSKSDSSGGTGTTHLKVLGTFSGSDAECTVGFPVLADAAVNKIYGACNFSDPRSATNEEYILLATNNKVVAVKTSDSSTVDIEYTSPITVSSDVDMIQAFNKVYIFRKGEVALEIDLADKNISSIGSDKFTAVSSGTYTQPTTIPQSAQTCTLSITNSIATVAVTVTSGGADVTPYVKINDTIVVKAAGGSGFERGLEFTVNEVTSNGFKFFVGDRADKAALTNCVLIKKTSSDLGFIHMPTPEFATLHQRRLVMPFQFDPENSNASRKILDEVIVSDILDSDTYDKIFASFRFNAGTSDFTVGITSFTEDSLIIFNKNSIHRVFNTVSPRSATSRLITDEIGCLARKSIVQVGKNVFFLSDNGVYSLEFIDEFNLRGTQLPLSESIASTIARLNQDAVSKATAVYFDNRYYLAVPIDGSDKNNAIIIYNFINKSWESLDTFPNNFFIDHMIVSGKGSHRGIYIANEDGGMHKLEENDNGADVVITQIGGSQGSSQVPGVCKTRMYTMKSLDTKKFKQLTFHWESGSTATNADLFYIAENTDSVGDAVGSDEKFLNNFQIATVADEDRIISGRVGTPRSYGIQYKFNISSGRPKIKSLKTTGQLTYGNMKSFI